MKVKDVILILSTYDPELEVVIDVVCSGIDSAENISAPRLARIVRNANPLKQYWTGRHEYSEDGEQVVLITAGRSQEDPSGKDS
jgi:hypothetical protein